MNHDVYDTPEERAAQQKSHDDRMEWFRIRDRIYTLNAGLFTVGELRVLSDHKSLKLETLREMEKKFFPST